MHRSRECNSSCHETLHPSPKSKFSVILDRISHIFPSFSTAQIDQRGNFVRQNGISFACGPSHLTDVSASSPLLGGRVNASGMVPTSSPISPSMMRSYLTRLRSLDTGSVSTLPPDLSMFLSPLPPNRWILSLALLSMMKTYTRMRKGPSCCQQRGSMSEKARAVQFQ